MSPNVLQTILSCADAQASTSIAFCAEDVSAWSAGALGALTAAGVLRQGASASGVICPGCEERCQMEVEMVPGPSGRFAPYVICQRRDDVGAVPLRSEDRDRWVLDLDGLAHFLTREAGALGAAEALVPGRLWALGRPIVHRRPADLFLARGLAWPDAHEVIGGAGRLRECDRALVLVPSQVPPADSSLPAGATVVSLARILSLDGDGAHLDRAEIERLVGKDRTRRTQDVIPFPTPPGTAWEQVALTFYTQNEKVARVTAGAHTDHKTFEEMGFSDKRKPQPEPDSLWALLRTLGKQEGAITWSDDIEPKLRSALKRQVSDLRRRLQSYLGIGDDPFYPYTTDKGYRARFAIRVARPRR